MDSLPSDLLTLIHKFSKASELIHLGTEIPDNEPYLDLIYNIDRYKLALKRQNIPWILETIDELATYDNSFYISKYAIKYPQYIWITKYSTTKNLYSNASTMPLYLAHLQIFGHTSTLQKLRKYGSNHSYYPYYYYGKQGVDMSIFEQPYFNPTNKKIGMLYYVDGLAKGQHYDLFDQYYQQLNSNALEHFQYDKSLLSSPDYYYHENYYTDNTLRFLLKFTDEDQLIVRMKNLYLDDSRILKLLPKQIANKRYKVVSYLLSCVNKLSSELLVPLVVNDALRLAKDCRSFGDVINENQKTLTKLACIAGAIESIKIIHKCVWFEETFFDILKQYHIDNDVYQYILDRHDQSFRSENEDYFESVKLLRPHFKTISLYSTMYSQLNSILISSLRSYIEGTSISEFKKAIHDIVETRLFDIQHILKECFIKDFYGKTPFGTFVGSLKNLNTMELIKIAKQLSIPNCNKLFHSELLCQIISKMH